MKSTERPQIATESDSGCFNVLAEFVSSTWRSGVMRPIESVGQLSGFDPAHIEVDDHLHGWMKVANIAGNATGQLLDMALLGVGLSTLIGCSAVARMSGVAAEGFGVKPLLTNSATGSVYGGLLTPLGPGENVWDRLRR